MKLAIIALAAMLAAGAAAAQATADGIVADLRAQGYTRIGIVEGVTQIKAEAIRGDTRLRAIYDRATGNVLKNDTGAVRDKDDTEPGVRIVRLERDFFDPAAIGAHDAEDIAHHCEDHADDGDDHDCPAPAAATDG